MTFYDSEITLINKNTSVVTPIAIKGDATLGNLTQYRQSGKYNDTINEVTKNGQITLRSPAGLFDVLAPILTNEDVKTKYLIQVQLSQGRTKGQLFRFEISSTTSDIGSGGNHITLSLTSYDIRTEEFLDSERLLLMTPKKSFFQRIINFSVGRNLSAIGSIKLTHNNTNNLLPDTNNLRQDWLPSEPVTTKSLLSEIISRVSTPDTTSSTNEDWYYNIVPQTDTESFRVYVDRFGEVDDRVTVHISPRDARKIQLKEIEGNFDNTKFKNAIILKGKKGTHTIPMSFTKSESDIRHANLSSEWKTNVVFQVGDYTIRSNKFYKCKTKHTSATFNRPPTLIFWELIYPSTTGSEWTDSVNLWLGTMSNSLASHQGYVGFFNDFNIVRRRYDNTRSFDEFDHISIKDVEDVFSNPSRIRTGEQLNGKRWLTSPTPSGAWRGRPNRIAQYQTAVKPNGWKFSAAPISGDIVNVLANATIRRFNGTTWITVWDVDVNPATSSPFFPVESLQIVDDRRGIRKAIEFRFNWNVFDVAEIVDNAFSIFKALLGFPNVVLSFLARTEIQTDTKENFIASFDENFNSELSTALGTGNARNKASRRYGFSLKLPFPKSQVGAERIGSRIKNSTLDFFNLNESIITGKKGWNNGVDSENLGNIRGTEFWVKALHRTATNQEVRGVANIPMIFWYRDLFDRIVFFRYSIRSHNTWTKITIPGGFDSNLEQFDSRIDELWTVLGYTFPFNHFIKDRELTGATFDWRYVKEMGTFSQDSYDDNFLYRGGQDSFQSVVIDHATQQLIKNPVANVGIGAEIFSGSNPLPVEYVVTDHVLFSLSDLHFIKDAFVNSEKTSVDEPRQQKVNAASQYDYQNMRQIAKRIKSRMQFHPEKHIIHCKGDVRIFAGHRFQVRGPNGYTKTLVATSVSHLDTAAGYNCIIEAVRKYAV